MPAKKKGREKPTRKPAASKPHKADANLPVDPKELFITSPKPISLKKLSIMYGGAVPNTLALLKKRSTAEKWVSHRADWHHDLEKKKLEAEVERQVAYSAASLSELNKNHCETINNLRRLNQMIIEQNTEIKEVSGVKKLVCKLKPGELRKIQQNYVELMGFERLVNNYPRLDPVKEKAGDTVTNPLSDYDKEILEAFKNGG